MLPDNRARVNVGVGAGFLLQVIGCVVLQTGDAVGILGGSVLVFISIPVFIWGCTNYAEAKGHSKWIGLVGLAGIVGLLVLIMLPDQERKSSISRLQLVKCVCLVSMVTGLGLVVLGVWLHNLGDDVRLERLLHPWPWICMLAGAFLAIASVLFIVREGRR